MPASPDFPAGPPPSEPVARAADLAPILEALARAPQEVRAAVGGLTDAQLDVHYRNWTPRQIVHHLADSHAVAYTRFKLALTEDNPTVRPFSAHAWASLPDARRAPLHAPLALIDAVHDAWLTLLGGMSWEDYERTFHHPEHRRDVPLALAVAYYAWHGRHHTAQIDWLAAHHGWRSAAAGAPADHGG